VPDHTGRHRRLSDLPIARLLVLLLALVAIGRLLTLPMPDRGTKPSRDPLALVPTWSGPAPVSQPGTLPDGTLYEPRIYLTQDTSVGTAPTRDARHLRVLLRTATGLTQLRRVPASDHPQFDGFTGSGADLIWAESISRADSPVRTSIWRANWRSGAEPVLVTSNTGDADFFQSQYDLLVHTGRVYWAAIGSGTSVATEVRSVPLRGGQVTIRRLAGEFALSAWPWAVSVGGRATPVELVNLNDGRRIRVATNSTEAAACTPQWCRMTVLGGTERGDDELIRIDLQRPDGSQRHRIAGSEATPSTSDVALLDRFVPLATDRNQSAADGGVGLSLHDIASGRTDLVAVSASNVQARDGVLFWSTGSGDSLTWHAIDLRTLL
jgi:hypothetical protein